MKFEKWSGMAVTAPSASTLTTGSAHADSSFDRIQANAHLVSGAFRANGNASSAITRGNSAALDLWHNFKALSFQCPALLTTVGSLFCSYNSTVAANPFRFATPNNFGRQYHDQINGTVVHEFGVTVKEHAPGADVSRGAFLLRAILRSDSGG